MKEPTDSAKIIPVTKISDFPLLSFSPCLRHKLEVIDTHTGATRLADAQEIKKFLDLTEKRMRQKSNSCCIMM